MTTIFMMNLSELRLIGYFVGTPRTTGSYSGGGLIQPHRH
jgi:hypothetical protein